MSRAPTRLILGSGLVGLLALLATALLGEPAWVERVMPTWKYLQDLPASALIVIGGAAVLLLTPRGRSSLFAIIDRIASCELRRPGGWLLASLLLMAVLFIGRSRNLELGDASVLIEDVPYDVHVYGQNVWPDEVLARLSRSLFYRLVHSTLGLDVLQAFALSSALWGVLYAAVLIGIGRTLFPDRRIARVLPLLLGFTIANVQLFFGYIEVYSGVTVCLLAFAGQAYRFLAGQTSIASPAACLALGIGFYAPAGAALPSLLVLCMLGPMSANRGALRRIALALAMGTTVLGIVFLIYFGLLDYPVGHVTRSHAFGRWTFLVDRNDPDFRYRTFDGAHLRDLMLLMLRVSGPVLLLWITSWFPRAGRALWREPASRFELTFAAGLLSFCFLVHPDLGPVRDWDLLSFGSLGWLLLGSRWLGRAVTDERELARLVAPAISVGLLLTGSFVFFNATRDLGDPEALRDKERWWIQEWGVRDHQATTMHEFSHLAAAQRQVQLAFEAMAHARDDTRLVDLASADERARLMTLYRSEALPSEAEVPLQRASDEYREATRLGPDNLRSWYRWLDVLRLIRAPAPQLRAAYDALLAREPDPARRDQLERQRAALDR